MALCEKTLMEEDWCSHCTGADNFFSTNHHDRKPNVDVPDAGKEWGREEATALAECWLASSFGTFQEFAIDISADKGDGLFKRSASAITTQLTKATLTRKLIEASVPQ